MRIEAEPAPTPVDGGTVRLTLVTLIGVALLGPSAGRVETELQLSLLREMGVTYGQGYLRGRPMDAISASRILELNTAFGHAEAVS